MSLRKQMLSFFDELSHIKDDSIRKERDEEMERGSARPFSSMLTQDEEPTDYMRANIYNYDEPEVIVARRIV